MNDAAVRNGRCLLLLACLGLAACAGGPPRKTFPDVIPAGIQKEIAGVPFHPQETMQCGPAALATALGWSGVEVSPQALEPYLFLPERGGTLQPELKAQARRFDRVPYQVPADPEALLAELAAGHPVLVLQNNGIKWLPAWHYAVVVGLEDEGRKVVLRSGTIREHALSRRTFLNTWRRSGYWGLVVLPPDRMPASLGPLEVLAAINDFARVGSAAAISTALQEAVYRWPEDSGLRFALANRLYQRGDTDGAEQEYRRILAVDPGALMARNNLAWLLAEQGRNADALELIDVAAPVGEGWREPWEATRRFVQCRASGATLEACEPPGSP